MAGATGEAPGSSIGCSGVGWPGSIAGATGDPPGTGAAEPGGAAVSDGCWQAATLARSSATHPDLRDRVMRQVCRRTARPPALPEVSRNDRVTIRGDRRLLRRRRGHDPDLRVAVVLGRFLDLE